MNQLAHIFLTYPLISLLVSNAREYLIPIAVFAVILDLDHLPGFLKLIRMKKREASRLRTDDYVNMFRTAVQEPAGIMVAEFLLLFLYLFGVRGEILLIAGLCLIIHWIIDFLTVHTRPFTPLNDTIVSLFFHTRKQRIKSEIIITLFGAVIFSISYFLG